MVVEGAGVTMTATALRGPNVSTWLKGVAAQAGFACEMGRPGVALDGELAGAAATVWVPIDDSGKMRPCTTLYEGLQVYWETSLEYTVNIRAIDLWGARTMMTRLINAMVNLGNSAPGVEYGDTFKIVMGKPDESGCLIQWPVRVWEPVVHEEYVQGHIETTATTVEATDQLDVAAGSIP
jgi:hypothetical protein